MEYDAVGRRTSLSASNGRSSTMAYTNGLLSSLTQAQNGVAISDLAYDYAVDGQLIGIRDLLDPAASIEIDYDNLNRLVMVSEGVPSIYGGVPIPVEDFAYDGEGNRISSHLSTLYLSDDHNRLTEDSDYTYSYDDRGNRVSRTAKAGGVVETYTYNSVNKLVAYDSGTGTVASYFYDALGRRIAKDVDGVATAYVYDPWNPYSSVANDILLEFENGTLTRRWQHGAKVDEPLAFEGYAGTTVAGSGSEFALFADRQGSILAVVDPITGTLAAEYTYDAFGQITQTGALQQPFGYTGREFDAESGLYYYRARYYDPALGMFIQSDPIGFAAGDLNIYAYVWNDPFNWTDPSGLGADGTALDGAVIAMNRSTMGIIRNALLGATLNMIGQILNSVSGDGDNDPNDEDDENNNENCNPQTDPDCANKVQDALKAVSSSCIAKFKCIDYANELQENLESLGVNGARLEVNSSTGYLESLENGVISTNGRHDAIQVGNTVYDNLNVNGVNITTWEGDLGIGEYPEITVTPTGF